MTSSAHRSRNSSLPLLLAVLVTSACGDDSDPVATGGAAGLGGATGTGGGGAGGSGGSSGSAGSPSAVVPDPRKDCGVAANPSVPPVVLTQLVAGLERPIYLTQPPGDTARLFIVEKAGRIRILRAGTLVEAPYLTVAGVSERNQEMGLLGMAFHPDYAQNGRFYVYYSTLQGGSAHISRVAEYHVSADNPDLADAASERVLLEVPEPEDNHNGGNLQFGADGYLYIGLGDGGGGGDQHPPSGNGQNLATLLGKILRIDVDGTGAGAYGVPAGNLVKPGALPEIWSYGLRNPWRYSFDPCTGDMYIGDVGQGQIEEVDFEPAGASGRNYGWRLMEGTACFNPDSGCDAAAENLVLPVATYNHDVGLSITGGYVYRGHALPDLRGTYLYADYQTARFFALRMSAGSVAAPQLDITDNINPGTSVQAIASFGEDDAGELYVIAYGGTVYRIDAE